MISNALSVRNDTDAPLRQPLGERPPGLVAMWDTAINNTLSVLDRLPTTLTERVRLVDVPIAKLMAIKQLGWPVRDDAGPGAECL
jgi:hypothetical protein